MLRRLTAGQFARIWLPALLMVLLIAGESTPYMSGENTAGLLMHLLALFGIRLRVHLLHGLNIVLRESGHAIGFGLLSFLFFRAFRDHVRLRHGLTLSWRTGREARYWGWRPVWSLGALLLTFAVAAADELHQMTIPGRTGSWRDVLLDAAAGMVVQVLLFACLWKPGHRD